MIWLILGLVIFLGVHSTAIFASEWRARQIATRGEAAWKGAYTVLSLSSFALLVYGYGVARQSPVVLYTPPAFLRHLTLLLMLPAFVLLFAANLPGRIKTATKHPMLLATKIWATSHLLVNGTLGAVILFGGFLAWAVLDRISMKRRTGPIKVLGVARPMNDLIALGAGFASYVVFLLWGHQWLIGVSPLG
ncbi:MAG: NnrU family protein [Pseudorhodobacter sp.]|nr:NnrU family protein [Rhizobacter sp.]